MPTSSSSNSYCHGGKVPCTFTAGPVRLVYFPVEVKGDRLCGNYSTIPPLSNLSTPVTVEAYGTTFTSGTAYISFESLRAFDGCGEPTGTAMSNFFLPLPSSDVSSMCGANNAVFSDGPTSTSLNFADLDYPVATSVYKCQAKCLWGVEVADVWKMACRTIYDDYKPVLAYPSQVQQLQPEWNQCWFNPNVYFRYQQAEEYYLFDPPVALTQAASKVVPTLEPQPAHKTSSPVQQTSVVTSHPKESELPGPAPVSSVPDSRPTSDEGQPPDNEDPGEAQPDDPASTPDGAPLTTAQSFGNVPPPSSPLPAPEAAPVPAGLSVLTEALSKAIETARPDRMSPLEKENDPAQSAQNTLPASPGSIVTVLSAAPIPATISRSGSNYIVDGQTIGSDTAATIGGQMVSIASDANDGLVLGQSSKLVLADGEATTVPVETRVPATIFHEESAWVVAGETLRAGQVATVNGQILSVPSAGSGIVVDGETLLPNGDTAAVTGTAFATKGFTLSRAGSDYVVDGVTIAPGPMATFNGIVAALLTGGGGIVMGTSTISLPPGAATTMPPAGLVATDLEVSRAGSNLIIDGQTLTPGATTTINGVAVSALSNGAGVAIGASTISLPQGAATTLTPPIGLVNLDISRSGSIMIVDGHTVAAGQRTIIDGYSVSVLDDADGIVVGSRTISLGDRAFTTINVGEMTSTGYGGATTTRPSVGVNSRGSATRTAASSQSDAGPLKPRCGGAVLAALLWLFVSAS